MTGSLVAGEDIGDSFYVALVVGAAGGTRGRALGERKMKTPLQSVSRV